MAKIPPRKRKTARASLRKICQRLGLRFVAKAIDPRHIQSARGSGGPVMDQPD